MEREMLSESESKNKRMVWLLFLAGSAIAATILLGRYPPDKIDDATRQNIVGYIIVFYTVAWAITQLIFIYIQRKNMKT